MSLDFLDANLVLNKKDSQSRENGTCLKRRLTLAKKAFR